ncbi:methyl-accepting chemotaxis protein [Clostridium sp. BJN0001]|uniref:methyl-accepting chemotaxis protein n=1 Tax=Clostridium sp. BJN0001 TaxID=2930219 RepID=UPI001FD08483|nr:methyl-accepting chemotaxis protein [Clostridium sp. BJN0001]
MKKNNSLITNLTKIIIVLIILIFSLTTLLNILNIKKNMTSVLLSKSINTADEVKSLIEYIIENKGEDIEELQNLVEKKASSDNICYAVIIDKNCEAIAHSDSQKIGKVYDDDYTQDVVKNAKTSSIKFYADVQKVWSYDIVVPIMVDGSQFGSLDIGIPISGINSVISSFVILQIIIAIIATTLVAIIILLLLKRTLNPLKHITQLINETSELNFNNNSLLNKYVNKNNEIGIISKSLINMREKLKCMISTIKSTSDEINSFSTNLGTTVDNSINSLNNISNAISDIAKSSENQSEDIQNEVNQIDTLSSQVDNISNKTEVTFDKISNTANLSKLGSTVVQNLSACSEKNENVSNNIKLIVTDVDKNSKEIGSIIETIDEIAEQTNLLALNASIEAARAGESGKGFTVVAEEVKKLAEETSKFTNEIKEKIKTIQTKSDSAVSSVEENINIVNENTEAVQKTENIFKQLTSEIAFLSKTITEIVDSNKTMLENKNAILDIIQNTSSGSEETTAATQEINSITKKQMIDINNLSSEVNKLQEFSDSLTTEMNKFNI